MSPTPAHETIVFENGDSYAGELLEGSMTGVGVYEYHTGDVYEGELNGNTFHGHGRYSYKESGAMYRGCFSEDMRSGQGEYCFSSQTEGADQGRDFYEGDFLKDRMHGVGRRKYLNGDCYEGDFENGMKHGRGEG